jgi:DNA polymerase-3 subunit gamma/tau
MNIIDSQPTKWDDVYFQDSTVKVLRKAMVLKKLKHGVLFKGRSGRGKTTLSYITAQALVCENLGEDGNPCCVCPNCRDIIEKRFERSVRHINGQTDNGIDYYRDLLRSLLEHGSFWSKNKVVIIDEIHGLSKESLDALLIPLEKENKNVYFIFATTEAHKIKETLESRCLSFNLVTPNQLEIAKYLVGKVKDQKVRATDDFLIKGLFRIACSCDGNIRKALNTLEKVLLSGELTLENVEDQIDNISEAKLFDIIFRIMTGEDTFKTGYIELTELLFTDDPIVVYKKMFGQVFDIYRRKCMGVSINRPYYEQVIDEKFKEVPSERIEKFMNLLIKVRELCGVIIDMNILLYHMSKLYKRSEMP